MKQFFTLDSKSTVGRIAVAAAIILALAFIWFGVRWQIGNMLAELTSPNQDDALDIGNFAAGLSPNDPLPKWLIAAKQKQTFSPENTQISLGNFKEVVRLSPNDFRWWIELGRAFEQAGMTNEAEGALIKSALLAPNYTFPRWQLGNFYLRQKRSDEAFAELLKAADKSSAYREQIFSLAWDYFDKDPQKVEQLTGDSPEIRVSLAEFYATRSSPKNALRIWDTLDDQQKTVNSTAGKKIAKILTDKLFFNEAVEFARQSGTDINARTEAVTNGDFESSIAEGEESLFGWKVNRTIGGVDTSPDSTTKHKGSGSIKTTFRTFNKPALYTLVQPVSLDPSGKYRLSFWVRTENLKSGGPPFLEIASCANDKVVAASEPFPTGTNDWREISVDFTVPETCFGVVLRTVRFYCGEQCPMTGTFWYDDFKIARQ